MRIENVRAIVTGAASGIGYQLALQLAGAGAFVAAGDLDEKGLEQLAVESEKLPGRVITRKLDVSQGFCKSSEKPSKRKGGSSPPLRHQVLYRLNKQRY